jgi:hypothetical protein
MEEFIKREDFLEDRNSSKQLLVKRGYKGEVCCVFCPNGVQSKEHLIFKSSYGGRI